MKDRKTYIILTCLGLLWCFPINRIYLGEKGVVLRFLTLNYFYFGAIADLFYMNKRFDEAMAKRGFVNSDIRNKQGR
jgi:hypothetical protein